MDEETQLIVEAVSRLEAENKALRTMLGVMLAHMPEALDAVELITLRADDLTLAQAITEDQRATISEALALVAAHARVYRSRLLEK